MKGISRIWTHKSFLIRNCKLLKKLSFVTGIIEIRKDARTQPDGRFIIYAVK